MRRPWWNRLSALDSPRLSRRVSRSYRPLAEFLEARCLLAIFPGNPLTVGTPQAFSGVGTANATTALNAFQTAIGGKNNVAGDAAATGFRTINWDAVKLDGTDFGGGANTTVI